jgi:hypothetical protein
MLAKSKVTKAQVNAARGMVKIDSRLGRQTPIDIVQLASLPLAAADRTPRSDR